MTKRRSSNDAAENVIKSYLTNPHVVEFAERLRNIPMTCLNCHTKGLVENGEPRIEQCHSGEDLVDVTFVEYICPTCGTEFIKYSSPIGGGILEKQWLQ